MHFRWSFLYSGCVLPFTRTLTPETSPLKPHLGTCAQNSVLRNACLWLRLVVVLCAWRSVCTPFAPVNPAQNAVFCVASQVNNTVTSINIAGNENKAEGAKAFAEMLKVCSVCFSLVAGVVVGLPVDWLRVFLDVCTRLPVSDGRFPGQHHADQPGRALQLQHCWGRGNCPLHGRDGARLL